MTPKVSQITEALLETAGDLHRIGIMSDAAYERITLRHLGPASLTVTQPITGPEIRTLREKANLSQAAFARFLNFTTGYVSQLERGVKKPYGLALTLLNVLRRKGLEAIL